MKKQKFLRVIWSQYFRRGTRPALKSSQRQPLPWCTGQPSQGRLFLLNMFSDLCNQAGGVQQRSHLHLSASRLAGVCASGQIGSEMMLLSEGPFEVFCALPEPGYISKVHIISMVVRGQTTLNGRSGMKCSLQISSTMWMSLCLSHAWLGLQ